MDNLEVKPHPEKIYSKRDLMGMDPPLLRALLRERVHHTIEVPFNAILENWSGEPIPDFGKQAQAVLKVWKERDLTTNDPDIQWAEQYCKLANKIQSGSEVNLDLPTPSAFDAEEMGAVEKLIYTRNSTRNWADKPIPDEKLRKILNAGRAAPVGGNLDEIRYVVMRDSKEKSKVQTDTSLKNSVVIAICYDKRIPEVVGWDRMVPQNAGFDAAAAADHMLLMARALGLGGVWLSKHVKSKYSEDTGKKFEKEYGLPDYLKVALFIAIGWPTKGTIKSKRLPLKDMIHGDVSLGQAS